MPSLSDYLAQDAASSSNNVPATFGHDQMRCKGAGAEPSRLPAAAAAKSAGVHVVPSAGASRAPERTPSQLSAATEVSYRDHRQDPAFAKELDALRRQHQKRCGGRAGGRYVRQKWQWLLHLAVAAKWRASST